MIAVPYEIGCDPHALGEDFADQIRDACADERSFEAAREGLVVAVRQLDGNIIDMDGVDDALVDDLLGLPDGQVDRLRAALVEHDRFLAAQGPS